MWKERQPTFQVSYCSSKLVLSSPELFETRLVELRDKYLIPRDYRRKVIEDAFRRVRNITREEALKKVEKG